jgi:hypothetical protein
LLRLPFQCSGKTQPFVRSFVLYIQLFIKC